MDNQYWAMLLTFLLVLYRLLVGVDGKRQNSRLEKLEKKLGELKDDLSVLYLDVLDANRKLLGGVSEPVILEKNESASSIKEPVKE